MRDRHPSPSVVRHLALLATTSLTHDERRRFVQAHQEREAALKALRDLAEWIVGRAIILTEQDHPGFAEHRWGERQTDSFNRWLERLTDQQSQRARDITAVHRDACDCMEDLARGARFRSAEHLAHVLMLDTMPLEGAANAR